MRGGRMLRRYSSSRIPRQNLQVQKMSSLIIAESSGFHCTALLGYTYLATLSVRPLVVLTEVKTNKTLLRNMMESKWEINQTSTDFLNREQICFLSLEGKILKRIGKLTPCSKNYGIIQLEVKWYCRLSSTITSFYRYGNWGPAKLINCPRLHRK